MRIAIDFDGTIHPYSNGWIGEYPDDEPPIEGTKDFLKNLYDAGYHIIIFSVRANTYPGLAGIYSWLKRWDLLGFIHSITHEKPSAIAYIDDRAIRFRGEWNDDIMNQIKELEL